jgi:hypothetical protein
LIDKFDSNRYLISTNGSNSDNSAAETIATVIKRGGNGVEVYFNCRSEDNKVWDSRTLKIKHNYKATYPEDGNAGIAVPI